MSENSKIEWTERTWNPVVGCSKVSEGCRNCYAIRGAWRMQHNPNERVASAYNGTAYKGHGGTLGWTGHVNLLNERLTMPFRWKDGRVFVNSQSDLFHPQVPFEFIDLVMLVMALNPQLTFQILTKRPERMVEYFWQGRLSDALNNQLVWGFDEFCIDSLEFSPRLKAAGWKTEMCPLNGINEDCVAVYEGPIPLPNLWLGVSVEDQASADERIPLLLQTPAAVRWVSAEPLLGPVTLKVPEVGTPPTGEFWNDGWIANPDEGDDWKYWGFRECGIRWVVVGGESGPGARPMHPDWARSLRDQCVTSRVPFFFKQWGEWHDGRKVGKKIAWKALDGRTWDEFPETAEAHFLAEMTMRMTGALKEMTGAFKELSCAALGFLGAVKEA